MTDADGATDRSDLAERLAAVGVANLCDGGAAFLGTALVPRQTGRAIAGRATTAMTAPGDNLAAQVALAAADVGDVVLVVMPDEPRRACWGELMAVSAMTRGIVALVCIGAVRDLAACRELGFPIWSTDVCPVGPTKSGPGSVHERVTIGTVPVGDGDWLIADDDGVATVTVPDVHDVLAAAEAKAAREPTIADRLRDGATTMDALGLDVSSVRIDPRTRR